METEIIDYIRNISKGVCSISAEHAKEIIRMVNSSSTNKEEYTLELLEWNNNLNKWRPISKVSKDENIFNELLEMTKYYTIIEPKDPMNRSYSYVFSCGSIVIRKIYSYSATL